MILLLLLALVNRIMFLNDHQQHASERALSFN